MPNCRIVIGISTAEQPRYAAFYECVFANLQDDAKVVIQQGAVIAKNRNEIAKKALAYGAEYIWYVDDDQILLPGTLAKLLAHDKDIVSGTYLQRGTPFTPHVYDRPGDGDGSVRVHLLKHGEKGLIEALAVGAGCMLVKTAVFEKLEQPWWRLGQINPAEWGDDIDFCNRVREAGFKIYADLDTLVGHFMPCVVFPHRAEDGTWSTVLTSGSGKLAQWPATIPTIPSVPPAELEGLVERKTDG